MSAKLWSSGVLIAALVSLPVGSASAEDEISPADAPVSSEPAVPEAAPETAPAPVVPEAAPEPVLVTPPALKPITITFSGDLSAVQGTDTPPMIAVQDRYGVKKEISVPSEAKISQGSVSKALTDLKAGDKLTVEYTYDVATGKRTAQSISIGEPSPAAP